MTSELDLLKVLEAVNKIAPTNIYNFGLALGLHSTIIDEYNGEKKTFLRGILKECLTHGNLTWPGIVKALKSTIVNEKRLAKEIETNHCKPLLSVSEQNNAELQATHTSPLPPSQPSLTIPEEPCSTDTELHRRLQSETAYIPSQRMTHFIDRVKSFYNGSVVGDPKVVKLPKCPTKSFIDLVCVNHHCTIEYDKATEAVVRDGNLDVTNGKKCIEEIDAALTVLSANKVVLVDGAPGVGKSTFACEFCRRWARGEIAQQYQLVLLLRLSDKKISNAKSIKGLICHSLYGAPQDVYDELVHVFACNFQVLIILEGFDELPAICQKEDSVFMDLIAGNLLPQATILVTSRPWATRKISLYYENRICQHIQILGFNREQITEYIESALPEDKASYLKNYLERYLQIKAGTYIPLISAIVVIMYQERQYNMPTTLTELYTSLTQALLLRYLHGHPEYENYDNFLQTFQDLPPPIHERFYKLCEFAYDGIVATTISTSRHQKFGSDLNACTSDQAQLIFRYLPSDFDDFGFMNSVTQLYVTRGAVSSHTFLHLTFQEFLAAIHISIMSPERQVQHFLRHQEDRFKVVLRFLAGLSKLNCFLRGKTVEYFLQACSEGLSCDAAVGIDLVQWLFEAQSDDVIECTLGQRTLEFDWPLRMLPLDYYSLGYCISHSQCRWVLKRENEALCNNEWEMLDAGAAGSRDGLNGRIVGLAR